MIRFKPLPGLTLATLICLGILLSLGTWQYKRLHWKRDLLANINVAANADPIQNLAQLSSLIETKAPIDFRRVQLRGQFVRPLINGGASFYIMRSTGKTMEWRPYSIYEDGNYAVFIEGQGHHAKTDIVVTKPTPMPMIGYVRLVQKPNMFIPKSKPEMNSWFAFNPVPDRLDWNRASNNNVLENLYIDWQPNIVRAEDLPVKIPDIPNNHFDYMLTWYSFALILIIIYLILHKRQGRLSIGAKNA